MSAEENKAVILRFFDESYVHVGRIGPGKVRFTADYSVFERPCRMFSKGHTAPAFCLAVRGLGMTPGTCK